MSTFRAFRVYREADTIGGRIERIDLHAIRSPGEGPVVPRCLPSVNYKDARA